jgi:hypothetical protein
MSLIVFMSPPFLVSRLFPLLFLPVQLFFPGPSFQKSDHSGVVGPVEFFLAHLNSVAVFQPLPETLGFVTASHAGFWCMPQAVVTQGKDSV